MFKLLNLRLQENPKKKERRDIYKEKNNELRTIAPNFSVLDFLGSSAHILNTACECYIWFPDYYVFK